MNVIPGYYDPYSKIYRSFETETSDGYNPDFSTDKDFYIDKTDEDINPTSSLSREE